MRVDGKVAIITGAANGMGESSARLFAREGADLVLTDIMRDRGEAIAAEIRNTGRRAIFVAADVTSEGDWERVMARTLAEFGKLDILVNNAGLSGSAAGDIDGVEGWHRLIATNATSVFYGTRRAADIMVRAGRGSIVNVSSIMGISATSTTHPGYAASKAAVRNYSRQMASRLGKHGVRVNSVYPGYMQPMMNATNAGIRAERAAATPLGRTGEAIEVAHGILFLASDEASFITGAELVIDGGFLAR